MCSVRPLALATAASTPAVAARVLVALALWVIVFCSLCPSTGMGQPICDTGGPYVACLSNCPVPTEFDGSASSSPNGEIISYQWDFGDGGTGTGVTAEHLYEQFGDFTVILTVTDDTNAASSCTTVTEVHCVADAYPFCEIEPWNLEISLGEDAVFDGSQSRGACSKIVWYEWDFGDGTTANGVKVSHRYQEPGQFNVGLLVYDENAWTMSCQADVVVNTLDPVQPATWGRIKSIYR